MAAPQQSVRPAKLSEVLARGIVADIATRGVRAGERLPSEALMMTQFGVGRASLREALRLLELQGIVTIKSGPGGGPVVSELESAAFTRMATLHLERRGITYSELLDARLVLEPAMARAAAERCDAIAAELLTSSLERSKSLPDSNHEALLNGWADFHQLIGRLSGNRVMDLMGSALEQVHRERVVHRDLAEGREVAPSYRAKADADHTAIAKAIIAGKTARAERLMREHMLSFREGVLARSQVAMNEVVTWS